MAIRTGRPAPFRSGLPIFSELRGRRALVTGASSGIGRAIAAEFLRQGMAVAAQYHRQRRGAASLPGAIPLSADLRLPAAAARLVAAAARQLGGLDLLVHAAGAWLPGKISGLKMAEVRELFALNTFAAYALSAAAAPHLMRRRGSSIIFIGSTAGQRGEPGCSGYAGSKAALKGLMDSLAQELAPRVRVNMISPGWVLTPMSAPVLTPRRRRGVEARIPLRRIATPEDCAAAALFLASPRMARHLTGQEICLSGGALLPLPR
jgi:3-oxoacyl-[acyl-carrier protein] reductase